MIRFIKPTILLFQCLVTALEIRVLAELQGDVADEAWQFGLRDSLIQDASLLLDGFKQIGCIRALCDVGAQGFSLGRIGRCLRVQFVFQFLYLLLQRVVFSLELFIGLMLHSGSPLRWCVDAPVFR